MTRHYRASARLHAWVVTPCHLLHAVEVLQFRILSLKIGHSSGQEVILVDRFLPKLVICHSRRPFTGALQRLTDDLIILLVVVFPRNYVVDLGDLRLLGRVEVRYVSTVVRALYRHVLPQIGRAEVHIWVELWKHNFAAFLPLQHRVGSCEEEVLSA